MIGWIWLFSYNKICCIPTALPPSEQQESNWLEMPHLGWALLAVKEWMSPYRMGNGPAFCHSIAQDTESIAHAGKASNVAWTCPPVESLQSISCTHTSCLQWKLHVCCPCNQQGRSDYQAQATVWAYKAVTNAASTIHAIVSKLGVQQVFCNWCSGCLYLWALYWSKRFCVSHNTCMINNTSNIIGANQQRCLEHSSAHHCKQFFSLILRHVIISHQSDRFGLQHQKGD